MKVLIILAAIIANIRCGIIHQEVNHGKATSYQSFNLEHYHPVPTYIKGEDKHNLEHSQSLGHSSSDLQVQHGGKHDYGYAVANTHSTLNNHEQHHLQTQILSGAQDTSLNDHHQQQQYANQQLSSHSYESLHSQPDLKGYEGLTHGHGYDTASNHGDLYQYNNLNNHQQLSGYQDQNHDIGNYADAASLNHYQVAEDESHVQGS